MFPRDRRFQHPKRAAGDESPRRLVVEATSARSEGTDYGERLRLPAVREAGVEERC